MMSNPLPDSQIKAIKLYSRSIIAERLDTLRRKLESIRKSERTSSRPAQALEWLDDVIASEEQLILAALEQGYFSSVPLKKRIGAVVDRGEFQPGDVIREAGKVLMEQAPKLYHMKSNTTRCSRPNTRSRKQRQNDKTRGAT